MIRAIKYIFGLFLLLIITIIIYTTSYYLIEIRPMNNSMTNKIKNYSPLSTNHLLMEKMALKEEGKKGIARYVAHTLAVENSNGGFRNYWHLVGLHWHLWLRLSFSEKETFKLWLAIAANGNGRGMNEAATLHFNKPFSHLSCNQLAQLVVMVRSPTTFKPGSKRNEQRVISKGVANECNS